ncbi:MAG: hypothetical protein AAF939_16110 [Planctomycetota bacterium]
MLDAPTLFLLIFSLILSAVPVDCQEIEIQTIVEGLNHPMGVTVQPETGTIFVSDSGAARVIRIIDQEIEEVVIGFPVDQVAEQNATLGPLGLCFLDQNTLVIGEGGQATGEDQILRYKVPAVGEPSLNYSDFLGKPMTMPAAEKRCAEQDFQSIVSGARGVFVASRGDHEKGWISLATHSTELEEHWTEFSRLIPSRILTNCQRASCLTKSPQGYLLVGLKGQANETKDSSIAFFSEEGELLSQYQCGLKEVAGLAYDPSSNRLFAIDSPKEAVVGGLYQLIEFTQENRTLCQPRLIVPLPNPTSCCFDPHGNLLVTLAREKDEKNDASGSLIQVNRVDLVQILSQQGDR